MRSAIVTAGLVATLAVPAFAHTGGVIRIISKQVSVGGELIVRGEKLPKNATLRMELRGMLETFPLAEVRTDTAGRFQAQLALPVEVKAGTYTVVVVASDGDVAARVDLVVSAPRAMPGMRGMAEHEAMVDSGGAPGPHATAEMMTVQLNTSSAEWGAIAAVILLSAAGGLLLLASSRRQERALD